MPTKGVFSASSVQQLRGPALWGQPVPPFSFQRDWGASVGYFVQQPPSQTFYLRHFGSVPLRG